MLSRNRFMMFVKRYDAWCGHIGVGSWGGGGVLRGQGGMVGRGKGV